MTTHLHCACATVHLEVERIPILTAECHCTSCRAAGDALQALPGSRPLLESNRGTRFVLYRKDRVRIVEGTEQLRELRLTPTSTTRRVGASCCNTPLFLEFEKGHWLSLYASLWPDATRPPLEMRTMLRDRADGAPLPDDVPGSKTQSLVFMAKLLGAWIAMGFRVPKVAPAAASAMPWLPPATAPR